ncbi:MAG: uncharacterized SAM-binding protein YcdF (DUF218 family), partial [Oceanospirillaceae bacterium]
MDLFYFFSKLFWFIASPDNFLIILVFISALLVAKKSKWGLRLLVSALICFVLILFFPVADIFLRPLEKRFPMTAPLPQKVEGIIVLGGAERGELGLLWKSAQFNAAAERMMAIPTLARRYPQAKIVF